MAGGPLTWACVEDGFYVASRGTVLLGYIDRIETARYQVCDADAHSLGFFAALEPAMRLLESVSSGGPALVERPEGAEQEDGDEH